MVVGLTLFIDRGAHTSRNGPSAGKTRENTAQIEASACSCNAARSPAQGVRMSQYPNGSLIPLNEYDDLRAAIDYT